MWRVRYYIDRRNGEEETIRRRISRSIGQLLDNNSRELTVLWELFPDPYIRGLALWIDAPKEAFFVLREGLTSTLPESRIETFSISPADEAMKNAMREAARREGSGEVPSFQTYPLHFVTLRGARKLPEMLWTVRTRRGEANDEGETSPIPPLSTQEFLRLTWHRSNTRDVPEVKVEWITTLDKDEAARLIERSPLKEIVEIPGFWGRFKRQFVRPSHLFALPSPQVFAALSSRYPRTVPLDPKSYKRYYRSGIVHVGMGVVESKLKKRPDSTQSPAKGQSKNANGIIRRELPMRLEPPFSLVVVSHPHHTLAEDILGWATTSWRTRTQGRILVLDLGSIADKHWIQTPTTSEQDVIIVAPDGKGVGHNTELNPLIRLEGESEEHYTLRVLDFINLALAALRSGDGGGWENLPLSEAKRTAYVLLGQRLTAIMQALIRIRVHEAWKMDRGLNAAEVIGGLLMTPAQYDVLTSPVVVERLLRNFEAYLRRERGESAVGDEGEMLSAWMSRDWHQDGGRLGWLASQLSEVIFPDGGRGTRDAALRGRGSNLYRSWGLAKQALNPFKRTMGGGTIVTTNDLTCASWIVLRTLPLEIRRRAGHRAGRLDRRLWWYGYYPLVSELARRTDLLLVVLGGYEIARWIMNDEGRGASLIVHGQSMREALGVHKAMEVVAGGAGALKKSVVSSALSSSRLHFIFASPGISSLEGDGGSSVRVGDVILSSAGGGDASVGPISISPAALRTLVEQWTAKRTKPALTKSTPSSSHPSSPHLSSGSVISAEEILALGNDQGFLVPGEKIIGEVTASQSEGTNSRGIVLLRAYNPRDEMLQRELAGRGWYAADQSTIEAPIGIVGSETDAVKCAVEIIRSTLLRTEGGASLSRQHERRRRAKGQQRILVLLSNGEHRSYFETLVHGGTKVSLLTSENFIVTDENLASLNPLRPRNLRRWQWWGRGLGIPEEFMEEAFVQRRNDGSELVRTIQDLLLYATKTQQKNRYLISILEGLAKSGYFGIQNPAINPEEWFQYSPVLLVETINYALMRHFVLVALETRAKLIILHVPHTPLFTEQDRKALEKTSAIIYPDYPFLDNYLVLRSGAMRLLQGGGGQRDVRQSVVSALLAQGLRQELMTIGQDEAIILQRHPLSYRRIVVGH